MSSTAKQWYAGVVPPYHCSLLPEAFGGAEEVAEGAGELAGLLQEVQVEVGDGDVLFGGLHPLHLGLTGLLKTILQFLGLAADIINLAVGIGLENLFGAPQQEQNRVPQWDIFLDLLLAQRHEVVVHVLLARVGDTPQAV